MKPFQIVYEYRHNVANMHSPPRMETVRAEVTVYSFSKESARASLVAKYHAGGGVSVVSVTDLWAEAK
jgi:hypothetical protein